MIEFRDYQEEIKGRVYAAWEAGCRSVMCQMPTGTGKTVVMAQMVHDTFRPSQSLCDRSIVFTPHSVPPFPGGQKPSMGREAGAMKERVSEAMRVLVVAHRKEILEQIKETLGKYGLDERLADGSIVVESIQKLSKGLMTEGQTLALGANAQNMTDEEASGIVADNSTAQLSSTGGVGDDSTAQLLSTITDITPSLVIIDEAHHCTAKTYRMLWEAFPEARFLGMTATPCRLKQEGFTELFDRLVCSWQVSRFVNEGWLALFDYVAVKPDGEMLQRVRSLKKRGVDGDYQMKEMGTVMDNRASIEQLYRSYKEYAEGKQGIIYAINKEHARHIADYYAEALALGANAQDMPDGEPSGTVDDDSTAQLSSTGGVGDDSTTQLLSTGGVGDDSTTKLSSTNAVAVVDSGTPKKERERINREYREGKIRILVNCDIYSEGYDAPFVEFIQLARPTLSLSKYLQQVGRGLRPNEGKEKTVILDNVGLYYMFGLPNEDRNWIRMFREGQILPAIKETGDTGEVAYFYRANINNPEINIDVGHDNEMVVVMKHDELAQQAEEKNADYEIFRISTGFYGIKKGEKICVDACYQEIGEITDGYAIAHYYGKKCVINVNGRQLLFNPDITRLHRKGIAEIKTAMGETSFYDLKTGVKYGGGTLPPKVVAVDFVEFLCFDDEVVLRVPCGEHFRFTKEDMVVKGDVFQRRDIRTGVSVFVHRNRPKEVFLFMGYDNEYRKALNKIDRESIADITDMPNHLHRVYFYKDGEFTEKKDTVTCTRWDDVNRKVNARWYEPFYQEYEVRKQRELKEEEIRRDKARKEALNATGEGNISSVPLLRWTKDKNTRLYGSKTWGEVEIPPMYTAVDECNDRYAIVRKKHTNGLLINRRNEIVYGDANTDVHNLCRGDFVLVSKLNSNNIDEKFFVDIRDKNFRMYKCSHGFPSRKTFGGVEFVELDGIAYLNHPKQNNVHILGLNMQFDGDGVFHSERIPGEEPSSGSEVVMFEEMEGEVFVVKGEHRQGGLILSNINDMRSFYHWSGNHKERPMKCNINQRTLLLYMKARA